MSKLKSLLESTLKASALAALVLALLAPGTAFADLGDVVEGSPLIPEELVPPLLGGPGQDDDNGLGLGDILPPALTPAPKGTTKETAPTPPRSAAPKQTTLAPKPATSDAPKAKRPTTRIADTSGPPKGSATKAASKSRARPAARTKPRFDSRAFHDAEPDTGAFRQTASSDQPASPSLVGRVIDRIPTEYRVALVALALLSTLFGLVSLRERRRARRVERQALVDALTALPNRQAFEQRLAREWRRSERYDRELGVLMVDLDGFKEINDGQGHAAGDEVLRQAATLISDRVRASDMAGRWGGDEFVVLCPETSEDGLKVLARSLEDRLAHASIRSSVGFAQRESGDLGPADLLARADASMYRRKERGRMRPERRAVTPTDTTASFAALGGE